MIWAAVFPGQGSQEVGMGRELASESAEAREVFAEADDALGIALTKLIFDGPEDELHKTEFAQPAILATSIAVLRAYEARYGAIAPAFMAGHSLGEYTALCAAGSISLADAVRLVRRRGALMQDAVPLGKGAMSAVLGMELDAVRSVCADVVREGEILAPANVNSPKQIVISGDADAVARAGAEAKARGAKKVVPLNVSAPFHCELMRPVADELKAEFARVEWRDPSTPIAANVGRVVRTAAEARDALYEQTYSPVLWSDDVLEMSGAGVGAFVEFGPGSVLSGLIKRIAKGAAAASVGSAEEMERAHALIGGDGK